MFRIVGRILLGVLPLILLACSHKSLFRYEEQTKGSFVSARLTYPAHNQTRGMELQFLMSKSGLETSLSIFAGRFSSLKESSRISPIVLMYNGEKRILPAYLMEGAQRVRLTEESSQILIQHLLEGHTLTLYSGSHIEEIDP
ncbi:MAG: hypothetical protein ACKVOH_05150, partial [Chlamydiales bacterium]